MFENLDNKRILIHLLDFRCQRYNENRDNVGNQDNDENSEQTRMNKEIKFRSNFTACNNRET